MAPSLERRVAIDAARAAGQILRTEFRAAHRVAFKGQTTNLVTEMDERAEELIVGRLASAFPDDTILAEERGAAPGRSGRRWIVDPLDGTTNFLHGFPNYAVSIGCVVGGALCVGVIHDVTRDVVYRAWSGGGAWRGESRMSVSAVTDPGRALIATGFPFRQLGGLEKYLGQFAAVTRNTSGIRRAGSAALDLAHVAAGNFDAFWEQGLAAWDLAAGVVLIREAGGRITRPDGNEDVLDQGGGEVVGGNPAMHEWLLNLLRDL